MPLKFSRQNLTPLKWTTFQLNLLKWRWFVLTWRCGIWKKIIKLTKLKLSRLRSAEINLLIVTPPVNKYKAFHLQIFYFATQCNWLKHGSPSPGRKAKNVNVRENNVKNAVCIVAEMKWKKRLAVVAAYDFRGVVENCWSRKSRWIVAGQKGFEGASARRNNDFLRRFFWPGVEHIPRRLYSCQRFYPPPRNSGLWLGIIFIKMIVCVCAFGSVSAAEKGVMGVLGEAKLLIRGELGQRWISHFEQIISHLADGGELERERLWRCQTWTSRPDWDKGSERFEITNLGIETVNTGEGTRQNMAPHCERYRLRYYKLFIKFGEGYGDCPRGHRPDITLREGLFSASW